MFRVFYSTYEQASLSMPGRFLDRFVEVETEPEAVAMAAGLNGGKVHCLLCTSGACHCDPQWASQMLDRVCVERRKFAEEHGGGLW